MTAAHCRLKGRARSVPKYSPKKNYGVWHHRSPYSSTLHVLNSVTYLDRTPICDWYVGVRTNTRRTCVKKRVDYVLKLWYSFPSWLVNIVGGEGLCDHWMSMRIFTVIMNEMFHMNPQNNEESGFDLSFDLNRVAHSFLGHETRTISMS